MSFLNFFDMFDNYEERAVDHFEEGEIVIDTAAVTDSMQPFETGVCHPNYNNGDWVIVEMYDTKEGAQRGHGKWVKKMTSKKLPTSIKDVSSATIANLGFSFNEEKRICKRK